MKDFNGGYMLNKKKSKKILFVAIILCLVSMLFAGLIQNDFGKVKIIDITLDTGNGILTGYLLVPENASANHPAPAVVTSHGYLNNREMQDINYVELSRRGYVVFAMDAYKHGNSSVPVDENGELVNIKGGGMIDAVEYLYSLPFVDKSHIGVTGHSMGGGFADYTLAYYSDLEKDALASGKSPEEAKALNKVAAGLMIGNVPSGLTGGINIMGEEQKGSAPYLADIGVIEGRYDEFAISLMGGSIVDLLENDIIKNFVALQTEDESFLSADEIVEGKTYINSETGFGIVFYSPWEIHPWNHFSTATARDTVEFFDATLGAPHPIPGSNQVWWLKELFNLVGLVGFFLFLVPCADLLLSIPFFNNLRGETISPATALEGAKQKRKFWIWGIVGGLLTGIMVIPFFVVGMSLVNPFWPQDTTSPIAVWALGSGLIGLLIVRITSGRMKGRGAEFGTKIGWKPLLKTIILAVSVISITYTLVFAADYFLKTDFRIWSFAVRVFTANKIWVALKYTPFFLGFFIINSLSVNHNRFANWTERKQIWASILFNIIGVSVFLAVQYLPILFTGSTFSGLFMSGMLGSGMALFPILLFPFVPILAITAVTGIKFYQLTGNIYLGGLVNALLITMITVANTSFTYPY
jgi:dienelactone hydrolase